MGFFDSLMANPSGSGIYGQSRRNMSDDIGYVNSLRKRNMDEDYNNKIRTANTMNDISMKQNRMQSIYGDNPMAPGVGKPGSYSGGVPSQGLNLANPNVATTFKEDPGRITDFQKAGLDLKKEDLANDRSSIAMRNKLGDERLMLDRQKHDLDVNKNQNIYDTKQADLERKRDEAEKRLSLAERQLQAKQGDTAATAAYHQAQIEAMNARHAADLAHRDRQLEDLNKFRDETLAERARTREQNSTSTTFGEDIGDDGKPRKVTTKKGSQSDPNDPFGIREKK